MFEPGFPVDGEPGLPEVLSDELPELGFEGGVAFEPEPWPGVAVPTEPEVSLRAGELPSEPPPPPPQALKNVPLNTKTIKILLSFIIIYFVAEKMKNSTTAAEPGVFK